MWILSTVAIMIKKFDTGSLTNATETAVAIYRCRETTVQWIWNLAVADGAEALLLLLLPPCLTWRAPADRAGLGLHEEPGGHGVPAQQERARR